MNGIKTCTAAFAINQYTLTYYAGPNGSISGTTSQTVNHGASGTAVIPVPFMGYHFVNWSDLSTANPRTDPNVTGNITVTANFAISPVTPVRISPNLRYRSGIQVAYDDCSNGDTIECQAVALSGDVLCNTLNKSVTLKGGYNANFTSITGYTTINGRMIISNGTVTVENIIIK
jgi:hypothetical protein